MSVASSEVETKRPRIDVFNFAVGEVDVTMCDRGQGGKRESI